MRSFTLLAVNMLMIMAGATIAPALPSMSAHFADQPRADLLVKLVLTLPGLFAAIGAPTAGALVDRFGRKRLLLVSVFLYAIGGSSGWFATTLPQLLAGRALIGLAVGGILTSVNTLIADYFEGHRRNRFMGVQAAVSGYGAVVFLLAGGFLAEWSWRGPFLVYTLAFVALPLAAIFLVELPSSQRAGSSGVGSTAPIPWRVTGLLFSLGYVSMTIFYTIPVQLPFHLNALGVTNGGAVGGMLACLTLTTATTSLQYGRLRKRLSNPAIFIWIYGFMAAGYVLIARATSGAHVVAGIVVAGLGLGMVVPNLNTWAANRVSAAVRGRVMGIMGTAYFLGQFSSPILIRPLIQRFGVGGHFAVLAAVLAALTAIFFVALRRLSRSASTAPPESPSPGPAR